MFSDTWTDIIVTDTHQSDGLRSIIRQSVWRHTFWKIIPGHKLKSNRKVFVDKFIHPPFYLPLLLSGRFMVDMKTHLTLLPFDMCIIGTLASEQPNHRLVQEMLCSMCRRIFLFMMFV